MRNFGQLLITSEQFVIKNVYAVQKVICAEALMREVIGKLTGRGAELEYDNYYINCEVNMRGNDETNKN